MARIWEYLATQVAIGFRLIGFPEIVVTGLGNQLVDDAVEFLLCEEVIVAMEENGYVVVDHQLVKRLFPSGSAFIEAPGTIAVVASHFIEGDPLDAAASLWVSAYELMAEDELEDSVAV